MFQYGILIKRVELNERSSCSDVSYSINSCWVPSQFNRIILIIVDALRYDFVNPTNSHTFYGGHMKNVNNLLSRNNGNFLVTTFLFMKISHLIFWFLCSSINNIFRKFAVISLYC